MALDGVTEPLDGVAGPARRTPLIGSRLPRGRRITGRASGTDLQPAGRARSPARGPTPPRGHTMSTDAIVLLKKDHQEMRKLFRGFEKAGEDATATKARLATEII